MSPARKTIQDTYDLLEEIGKGGMATVYKARQASLDRYVAIKEIKPAIAASAELVERFKREARTSASLVHENIIQVYNFCEPKKDTLFIVMEYVEGMDLKSLFGQAGRLPPRMAAIIARDLARGLAYAHSRGLVHRDVKPGNVMISASGEVKLMDFGIVREMDSDLTRTGAFLGTPSYMSPEQFLGDPITHKSDIFSLGVLLYEILAGQKPFIADNESSLSKRVRAEREMKVRKLNPEVPRKLASLVHKCMRKNQEKRPADAEELVLELGKVLKSKGREEDRRELSAWVAMMFEGDKTAHVVTKPVKKPAAADQGEDRRAPVVARRADEADKHPGARAAKNEKSEKTGAKKPEARTTRSSAVAKEEGRKKSQAGIKPEPARAENDAPSGDAIVKWLWRMILLAIVVFAAIIVFLLVNPIGGEDGAEEPSRIEKTLEWVQGKISPE